MNQAAEKTQTGLEEQVNISFGAQVGSNKLSPITKTNRDFYKIISTHEQGEKSGLHFLRGLCKGKRSDENLSDADVQFVIIDGDKGLDADGDIIDNIAPDPQAVHEALKKLNLHHVLYTSHSHAEVIQGADQLKVKWRAVIWFKGADWRTATRWIVDELNEMGLGVVCVPEMLRKSIPWFTARVDPDRVGTERRWTHYGEPLTDMPAGVIRHPTAFQLIKRKDGEARSGVLPAQGIVGLSNLPVFVRTHQIKPQVTLFPALGGHISSVNLLKQMNAVTERPAASGWWKISCPCPIHANGDMNPSAGLRFDKNTGKTGFQCFAGCDWSDFLQATGLTNVTAPQADPRSGKKVLDAMTGGFTVLDVRKTELDPSASNRRDCTSIDEIAVRYVFITSANQYYDTVSGYSLIQEALNRRYGNLVFKTSKGKPISASVALAQHKDCMVADGMCWLPSPFGQMKQLIYDRAAVLVNTWRGFALTPEKGGVQPWFDLAEHLIPDASQREHFYDRVAFDVQHPDEKPNWHIVFLGVHGAGKEAILKPLCEIFGNAASVIGNKEAKSDFDDGFAKSKIIVYSEVNGLAGDSMEELKRKAASGATNLYSLNPKGEKKLLQPNLWSMWPITNHENAMKLAVSERRFYVLRCNTEMSDAQITAYFHNWLNKGGSHYLFDWLLKRDLTSFNPNKFPGRTEGFYKMMEATKSDYEMLLDDWLENNEPLIVDPTKLKKHLGEQSSHVGLPKIKAWLSENEYEKHPGRVQKKIDGQILKASRSLFYKKELLQLPPVELYEMAMKIPSHNR